MESKGDKLRDLQIMTINFTDGTKIRIDDEYLEKVTKDQHIGLPSVKVLEILFGHIQLPIRLLQSISPFLLDFMKILKIFGSAYNFPLSILHWYPWTLSLKYGIYVRTKSTNFLFCSNIVINNILIQYLNYLIKTAELIRYLSN